MFNDWSLALERGHIGYYSGVNEFGLGWEFWRVVTPWEAWRSELFARDCLGLRLPIRTRNTVVIPLWLLLVAMSIPTFMLFRQQQKREGFCRTCKYDLTGNESGVWPECGTTVGDSVKPNR